MRHAGCGDRAARRRAGDGALGSRLSGARARTHPSEEGASRSSALRARCTLRNFTCDAGNTGGDGRMERGCVDGGDPVEECGAAPRVRGEGTRLTSLLQPKREVRRE